MLPIFEKDFNTTILIINKFIKHVTFITSKIIQSVKNQVIIFLDRLNIVN